MARLAGIMRGGSLLTRLVFFFSRRSFGKDIMPARVYALGLGRLFTLFLMEEGQEHAKQMIAQMKHLARMLVAFRLDFGTKTEATCSNEEKHS